MATNYPTSYDDGTTHGGPFIDVATPTDLQRNIAAVYRNNLNDIVVAIENKLGFTGETTDTTVDWALLTVGGTPNQGLRFAGTHAQWPALTTENGIFIDSTSGDVAFHKAGDPVGTFAILTSSANATWDGIYAADKDLSINSGDLEWIMTSPSDFVVREGTDEYIRTDSSVNTLFLGDDTGIDVIIEGTITADVFLSNGFRTIDAVDGLAIDASTEDIVFIAQSSSIIPLNTSGDPNLDTTAGDLVGAINELHSQQTWDTLYTNDKILNINSTVLTFSQSTTTGTGFTVSRNQATSNAATMIVANTNVADAQAALLVQGLGAVAMRVEPVSNPTAPFDAQKITMTSGGLDNEAMQGLVIDLTSNVGDLNTTPLRGIQLSFTDSGGSSEARAVSIGSNWDYGVWSDSSAHFSNVAIGDTSADQGTLRWSIAQTNDAMLLGLDNTTHSLIVCDFGDAALDFDHAAAADPTFFIHSSLAPTTDNGEYLGLSYLGLQAGQMETDRPVFDLTLKAVGAASGATTNDDGGNVVLEGGAGDGSGIDGIVKIGSAATTSHSLDALNDLIVGGEIEIDGSAHFDGITFQYNQMRMGGPIHWPTSAAASIRWSDEQTADAMYFAVATAGTASRTIIIGDNGDHITDYGYAAQTDPAVFINSAAATIGENLRWNYLGLTAGTLTTNNPTYDLTIKAANAWASATGGNRDGGNLILEGGGGQSATFDGIVQIGSGFTTSNSLDAVNDLGVLGDFEVDGTTYLDGNVLASGSQLDLTDSTQLRLGTSNDSILQWSTAQTNDALVWGLGNSSRTLIVTEAADVATDFSHGNKTNPTVIVHSADATSPLQNIQISHNQSDGIILTEAGDIDLTPAAGVHIITTSAIAKEALQIEQGDADQEFVYFNGTASDPSAGSVPADNITEINGAGAVIGPQTTSGSPDTGWSFRGMVKMKVDAVGGGTIDAWLPLYEPATS
jgi:hypothetical protein